MDDSKQLIFLLTSETTRENNMVSSDRAVHQNSIEGGLFNSRRVSKEPADRKIA